ncbi:hypothetical protein [Paraburkholderia humisilvae]|uniref:Uncharacterized protein n=1 Tax=Paraburkholderia humisilvae TaxID=627669 RepID=A0A6J5DNM4_9BURK|nr:hypothetical protein [Paraburkholderia humisilvae]CAB3755839.1 hypothetical protein LMG29542_02709 [Paraburkholderia humisilvae]
MGVFPKAAVIGRPVMRRKIFNGLATAVLLCCSCVHAQVGPRSTIAVTGVQVSCRGLQPYVTFTLPINGADQGRPGLVYIGMHDPSMSHAAFLTGNAWSNWTDGMFPVYAIVTNGLFSTTITLPLPYALAGGGWHLYAGYGALSDADESQVQDAINAIDAAKSLSASAAAALGVSAVVAAIDPDHYRRTLIQTDMTKNGKYAYVQTGVETNPYACDPQRGGGG